MFSYLYLIVFKKIMFMFFIYFENFTSSFFIWMSIGNNFWHSSHSSGIIRQDAHEAGRESPERAYTGPMRMLLILSFNISKKNKIFVNFCHVAHVAENWPCGFWPRR